VSQNFIFDRQVLKSRNFNPGPFTVQLSRILLTNFEINLAPSLLNFVRQAVPVPVIFLNYYRPGLLFADFGDAKTLVRWTRNHIGLLLSISWRCWDYLPEPSPRFLLFGRRGCVTLARFSYFPGTRVLASTRVPSAFNAII
jgi:hypothetical protein